MNNCPICSGNVNPFDNQCLTCGWDLTEFPDAFHIPESFEMKLQAAIDSARNGWSKAQEQAIELQQLKEENAKLTSDLKWFQFAATAEQRWQELDEGEVVKEGDRPVEPTDLFSLEWLVDGAV